MKVDIVVAHFSQNNFESALEIKNLELKQERVVLFSGLTLSLAPGEKTILTAPSGFGKSTLLRCLLGLVPATDGCIRIFGTELTPRSAWQMRCRMAYVDQEADLGDEPVKTILERPFHYKNNHHLHLDAQRLASLMERLFLPPSLLDKKASSLSGGEKQRMALIGALLLERDILLLDEPTSALDEKPAAAVAELLKDMKELTVLAVSHDPFLVNSMNRTLDLPHLCRRAS